VKTVDAPEGVTVEVTHDIVHRCPFVDEKDHGRIVIGWHCRSATLELHDLAAYLSTFADVAISHESLVDVIQAHIGSQPGISGVDVSATFTTAGMTVTARCP
jgi:NADPH-dependent 7-cyano-7-deazaguanine reductase QueF